VNGPYDLRIAIAAFIISGLVALALIAWGKWKTR